MRAAKDKAKIGSLVALHGFVYTTRANIAHEKAEQIRARIVCTPAEKEWRAWVESVRRRDRVHVFSFVCWLYFGFLLVGVGAYDDPHGRGINTYAKHVCWRRRDGAS